MAKLTSIYFLFQQTFIVFLKNLVLTSVPGGNPSMEIHHLPVLIISVRMNIQIKYQLVFMVLLMY